ncbi:mitochondrial distribution and morphology protein [Limnofasciculus baicalensis]|uniref:Mitochondrial distribution and morphology protein n=1 Tax=Limnofasciculus baicalensis BBK-W-15 TaxID=2699891 RepID=A0AAE3GQ42_9CYAN|nr:mitochondrial distribution and morphology protein [Limnofasciculus baicalensis]MCP2728064.1 mitochondrial distribution and morphology protein [Limnofasciculus baicalensis BBK-W-15]
MRSCTPFNKPEAEPTNPRAQVQPGHENIDALPLEDLRSQLYQPNGVDKFRHLADAFFNRFCIKN